MRFNFEYQGSASEPYSITIDISKPEVAIECNCKAGSVKGNCKHIVGVLSLSEEYVGVDVEDCLAQYLKENAEVKNLLVLDKEIDDLSLKIKSLKAKKEKGFKKIKQRSLSN